MMNNQLTKHNDSDVEIVEEVPPPAKALSIQEKTIPSSSLSSSPPKPSPVQEGQSSSEAQLPLEAKQQQQVRNQSTLKFVWGGALLIPLYTYSIILD